VTTYSVDPERDSDKVDFYEVHPVEFGFVERFRFIDSKPPAWMTPAVSRMIVDHYRNTLRRNAA
jgi:hypothetical protein